MGGESTTSTSPKTDYWEDDKAALSKSAASYAKEDKRVYRPPQVGLRPPVGMNISTDSLYPELILLDDTGSVSDTPEFLLERFPILYNEVNAVLQGHSPEEMKKIAEEVPDELAISIVAFGDAKYDQYPLQVTNFQRRSGLIDSILKIYPEGRGGANLEESYELALYYALEHCEMPNVPKGVKPLCIIFGDEAFYDRVNKYQVKRLIGDDLKQDLNTVDVIEELKKKFEIYLLRPEFYYSAEQYKNIDKKWREALGRDAQGYERVEILKNPRRIVDAIVALNGRVSGNWEEALKMLKRRQKEEQVEEVLRTIHH